MFTPKGRIMELPKGSTAVDFAYAVHTDVGNSCIACRINRRLAPLSEPLQSGSTVEIVSAPGARPNPRWLNFVVTGKARTHIRHALKLQRRSESDQPWRAPAKQSAPWFRQRAGENSSGTRPGHAQRIPPGTDRRPARRHRPGQSHGLCRGSPPAVQRTSEQLPSPEGPLAIRGTEGLVLSYAKCCTPIPGDPHRRPPVGRQEHGRAPGKRPQHQRNPPQPGKCIQLSWAKDVTGEFNVELRVELEHQRGLIALLASSVNAADGNIEKISMDERDGRISVSNWWSAYTTAYTWPA